MEKEHNLLESDVVTLTLDDDVEIECAIITTFNMDSTEYIALLPLDENGQNQNGEVYLDEASQYLLDAATGQKVNPETG